MLAVIAEARGVISRRRIRLVLQVRVHGIRCVHPVIDEVSFSDALVRGVAPNVGRQRRDVAEQWRATAEIRYRSAVEDAIVDKEGTTGAIAVCRRCEYADRRGVIRPVPSGVLHEGHGKRRDRLGPRHVARDHRLGAEETLCRNEYIGRRRDLSDDRGREMYEQMFFFS